VSQRKRSFDVDIFYSGFCVKFAIYVLLSAIMITGIVLYWVGDEGDWNLQKVGILILQVQSAIVFLVLSFGGTLLQAGWRVIKLFTDEPSEREGGEAEV
jgi:uncharacterized membrane protein